MQRLLALLTVAAFLAAQPVYACAVGCLLGAHAAHNAGQVHGAHPGSDPDSPHAPPDGGHHGSVPHAPCSGGAVTGGTGACQPPLTHAPPRMEVTVPAFFTALAPEPQKPAASVARFLPTRPDPPPPRA